MSILLQIEENYLCKIPCVWVDIILHQEMYVNEPGGGDLLHNKINLTFIIIDKSI